MPLPSGREVAQDLAVRGLEPDGAVLLAGVHELGGEHASVADVAAVLERCS